MLARARRLGLIFATATALAPGVAAGHPGVKDRIHRLEHELSDHPDDPQLYLLRGELHAEDGRFELAEADFDRAQRLEPERVDVHYYRGAMLLAADEHARSEAELTRFLADEPNHGKARFLRARARAAQGKHRAAADDYTAAIAEGTPRPELYFERARSVLALGPGSEDEALRGLDEGCDRLGTPVVLVELAITIEAERGNHAAAVTRLDALPDTLATSPAWLKRRADLLRGAGRPVESSVVYVIALWRITELQAARRNTPAMKRLEAEVRAALGL